MNTGVIFVFIVTTIDIVSYAPQLIKVFKTKSVDDLSLSSWLLWLLSTIAWVVYGGFVLKDPAVIIPCSVTLALESLTVIGYFKYRKHV